MKIAFATIYDSRDITRGSGTFYYLSRELEKQDHTIYRLGPIEEIKLSFISRIIRRLHKIVGKRYITLLDPSAGRHIGRQIEKMLANLHYDVLLTNDFSIAAFTNTKRPIILYTDLMITKDYIERHLPHSRAGNLSPISLWLCQQTIKRGLRKAQLSVFPAEWSATEALRYEPHATVKIIHFGANIDDPGPMVLSTRHISEPLQLMFLGKDWERKGGDIAVETIYTLRQRGINAHLHIVGSQGPDYPVDTNAITIHGLLNKADNAHQDLLKRLFLSAHALILPSTSEGFVIAPLEAAAFALPTLAYLTIGVDTAVKHEITGILLPLGAPASKFADVIMQWLECSDKYVHLSLGARQHFEESVNWSHAVHQLTEAINKQIAGI